MEPTPLLRAAGYALTASLLFTGMGVAVRYASADLPTEMVVFLRNLFGLFALLPWLIHVRGLNSLGTRRLPAHLYRASVGLAAMYCFFYAIAHLQLAEAVILNYSSPLFIALFALLLLGERANARLLAAIVIGLAGVALIVKPGTGVLSPAAIAGLASGVFVALAMVGIRHLSTTEPTHRIVFYFSLFSALISAVPLAWAWRMPGLEALIAMALAGIGATVAQLLLTRSYSLVPAAQIGPYTYSSVVFAALLGWLLWDEMPDAASFAGAALIVASGIITLRSGSPGRIERDA